MERQELLDVAVTAARAGGAVASEKYGATSLEVRQKGRYDYVTSADKESEEAILDVVRQRYPDHGILAEEGGFDAGDTSSLWIVDPLDGTNNYLQGLPFWCVTVAYCEAGTPQVGVVLDPLRGDLFTAIRGEGAWCNGRPMRVSATGDLSGAFLATGYPFRAQEALDCYIEVFREILVTARAVRRCGAAALDLAYTAAGIYDGFFEFQLAPWDVAAGLLMVQEAGGRVTDLDGSDRSLESGNVVAGGEGVWGDLLAAVARHADESVLPLAGAAER